MSALAGIATGLPVRELPRSRVEHYRDDGPLARLLGSVLGRLAPLPPVALVLAGMAPAVMLIAVEADGAPRGLAAGAVAWLVLLAGLSSGRPHVDRSAWSAPGLLRLAEYGLLAWIAALSSGRALPAAFALIAALAFRHYDLVYRERYQGMAPSRWLSTAAGGWDGRLLVASILLVAEGLPAGFFVLAAALGVAFVAESVASWTRFRAQPLSVYEDEEDEGQ